MGLGAGPPTLGGLPRSQQRPGGMLRPSWSPLCTPSPAARTPGTNCLRFPPQKWAPPPLRVPHPAAELCARGFQVGPARSRGPLPLPTHTYARPAPLQTTRRGLKKGVGGVYTAPGGLTSDGCGPPRSPPLFFPSAQRGGRPPLGKLRHGGRGFGDPIGAPRSAGTRCAPRYPSPHPPNRARLGKLRQERLRPGSSSTPWLPAPPAGPGHPASVPPCPRPNP